MIDNKKLLSIKIKKDKRKRLDPEIMDKIECFGLPIYLIILMIVSIGVPFNILFFWILFSFMIIPLICFLAIKVISVIKVIKLKSKIKKLPLNHNEIMMNFGTISDQQVQPIKAFIYYLDYMKAIKQCKQFDNLDYDIKQVLLKEIEHIENFIEKAQEYIEIKD